MKLALVVPPYIRPTSPPLGPAVLSAYIKENDPGVNVRCFDLNLTFYHSIFRAIDKGVFSIRLYDWNEKTSRFRLLEAVETISKTKWQQGPLEKYHSAASILLSFENIFNAFMTEMAKRLYLGQELPERIVLFFKDLVRPVMEFDPDLFGLSVQFSHQLDFAAVLLKLFREQHGAPTVMGGPLTGVIPHPEKLLTNPLKTGDDEKSSSFGLGECLDFLLPGEGEVGLLELCRLIKGEMELEQVHNLIYFKNGQLRTNEVKVIMDLEVIPAPDFSAFELQSYLTPELILPLQLSRGCPWARCTFCTHHRSYLCYRQLSTEQCIEQIETIHQTHQCHYFNFLDEMILPGRFQSLADSLLQKKIPVFYSAYGKPSQQFSAPLMQKLQRSGCSVIMWGLESANQRVLDLMDKGTCVDDVGDVIHNAAKAGIMNLLFVLFGFPTETEEEFFNTLQFLRKNRSAIHTLSMGTFVLTEGSRVHTHPEEFSVVIKKDESGEAIAHLDFDTLAGMSPETVAKLFKQHLGELKQIGLSHRLASYRDHFLLWASANKQASSEQ